MRLQLPSKKKSSKNRRVTQPISGDTHTLIDTSTQTQTHLLYSAVSETGTAAGNTSDTITVTHCVPYING